MKKMMKKKTKLKTKDMERNKNFTEYFKLVTKSIRYTVHEDQGVVVAQAIFTLPVNMDIYGQHDFLTIGISKVNRDAGDVFDEETGKKIARAQAEKEAFVRYKLLVLENKKYLELLLAKVDNTIDRMKANIQHQKDYLKSF